MKTLFKKIVRFINDPLQLDGHPTQLCDEICQKLNAQTSHRYQLRPRQDSVRKNQYDIVKL